MNVWNIFKSIDLWNNKILRAKCELPTDKAHIVNKEYVDTITTYDTEKAKKYKKPFLQWWMSENVFGFSYKNLLDDLLFPRLKPKYQNPEFDCMTFDVTNNEMMDEVQYIDGKKLMFYDLTYDFKVKVNLKTLHDRPIAKQLSQIRIEYPDVYASENKVFDSKAIGANDIEFELNDVRLVRGMRFIFTKQFTNSSPKNDTYGDVSIPNDFTIGYNLEVDLTDEFFKEIIGYDTLYVGQRTDEHTPFEFTPGLTYTKAQVMSADYHSYQQNVRFDVSSTEQNHRHVLIPEELFNRIIMKTMYFKRVNGGHILPEYMNSLTHQMLCEVDEKSIVIVTATGESIPYKMMHLELGCPIEDHVVRLLFDFPFKAYDCNSYYKFKKSTPFVPEDTEHILTNYNTIL